MSASEAYANCFIVTEADEYRFATRKVDGSDVEGIVSVDWLWSTKNAAGNPLVSEVSYKDGIVHFTSDGTEGNTVLAAFDAKGEVIWSWHLWMTDQPELFAYDERSAPASAASRKLPCWVSWLMGSVVWRTKTR